MLRKCFPILRPAKERARRFMDHRSLFDPFRDLVDGCVTETETGHMMSVQEGLVAASYIPPVVVRAGGNPRLRRARIGYGS